MWQVTEGGLWPTIFWKTYSADCHVNFKANISPVEPSDETLAIADSLIVALGDALKQRTHPSHAQISDPETEIGIHLTYFSFLVVF